MNDDPRLVQRRMILLEYLNALSKLIEGNVDGINWQLIAEIGGEIQATAKTAQTLATKPSQKSINKKYV